MGSVWGQGLNQHKFTARTCIPRKEEWEFLQCLIPTLSGDPQVAPALAPKGGHTVAWSVWYTRRRSLRQNLHMVNIDAYSPIKSKSPLELTVNNSLFFSPQKYSDPNCQPLWLHRIFEVSNASDRTERTLCRDVLHCPLGGMCWRRAAQTGSIAPSH